MIVDAEMDQRGTRIASNFKCNKTSWKLFYLNFDFKMAQSQVQLCFLKKQTLKDHN
jgi:hypothetical protein